MRKHRHEEPFNVETNSRWDLALFTTRYFAPAIPSSPVEGSTDPTPGPASESSPWPPPPLLSHVALDTVDLGDARPECPPDPSPAVAAEGCGGCWSVGVWLAGLLGGSGGGFFGLLLSPDGGGGGGGDAAVAAPAFSSTTGGASSSPSALRPPPPPFFSDSAPRRSPSSPPAKGFNDEEAVTKGLVGLVDGLRRSSTNGFRLGAAAAAALLLRLVSTLEGGRDTGNALPRPIPPPPIPPGVWTGVVTGVFSALLMSTTTILAGWCPDDGHRCIFSGLLLPFCANPGGASSLKGLLDLPENPSRPSTGLASTYSPAVEKADRSSLTLLFVEATSFMSSAASAFGIRFPALDDLARALLLLP